MRFLFGSMSALVISVVLSAAQSAPGPRTMTIYVVDVEGGNATLFVAPSGESVLIDTGNGVRPPRATPTASWRPSRTPALTQIDHLITTHWHGDHFGGMAELASRIPIRDFIDHGPERAAGGGGRRVPAEGVSDAVREGEAHGREARRPRSPSTGLDWRIVASAGQAIKTPLPGAGGSRIPTARAYKPQDRRSRPRTRSRSAASSPSEGSASLHLGDLTWNKEFELMCPNNRIGTVDLFVVSHHGQADLERRSARARARPARRDHEQRHAQGRAAGRDEASSTRRPASRTSGRSTSRS